MEQDELLIQLVQKFPHLYDKGDQKFKDKQARMNSWQTIAAVLNADAETCEQRWQQLRHRYTIEIRKGREESMSGAAGGSKPQWVHFAAMGFLSKFIIQRRTVSNIKTVPTPTSSSSSASSAASVWDTIQYLTEEAGLPSFDEEEESADKGHTDPIPAAPRPDKEQPSTSTAHVVETGTLRAAAPSLKRKKVGGDVNIMQTVAESLGGLSAYLTHKKNEPLPPPSSAEDHFGNTVASLLKMIKSSRQRRIIQAKIMQIFAEVDSDCE
ncbi:hypothetical protein FQR65_LT14549 [Abscondita terminalis]|nr:hypothetical protein FQR65_LT14549 [Abscondita terminalis]